ncbi:MAG: patatin [Proteobacteria bacterium]|nr:patatin [Pseudomonadota bacterium]
MAELTRILSIDGGGIRGIVPGQILVSLENKLKTVSGNPEARIADYFDLIAGTSTGGILTCVYLCPDKNDGRRSRFSAEQAVELYLERGDEIFDVSLWQKIKSGGGLVDEKFSADELEETLDDYLEDLKLSDLLKPCLITSYDIKRRRTHFFTKRKAENAESRNFYVKDVARATSAAPTYFEVARVKSLSNVSYPLIDGGVFANNPSLCAYAEARKLPGNPTAGDMAILSIGTGDIKTPYYYKDAKDWGLVQWIKPLIDIIMSAVPETVDFQLKQIYDAVGSPERYLRIDPDLGDASPDLDNATLENLKALKEAGTRAAEKCDERLNAMAELLVAHTGS